jgi:hypothetical protein
MWSFAVLEISGALEKEIHYETECNRNNCDHLRGVSDGNSSF